MTRVQPKSLSGPWAIFDHLLDAVLIVDRERRLHYINESFRNFCDVSQRAIANHDDASKYIELPEECWKFEGVANETSYGAGYREVGFITKNGAMGRVQAFTGLITLAELSPDPMIYLLLRDVTVEARLHAKYKVQIEANESLIGDLQRSLAETMFLKRLANELPAYADTPTLLNMVAERMKSELSFRDAHFFFLPDKIGGVLQPLSLDQRIGSRLREVLQRLGGAVRRPLPREAPVSTLSDPTHGLFWLAHVQPRLERPILLIASGKNGAAAVDHRTLLEALTGQVSTLLDNRALYFASITETETGLFTRRFFESRYEIECTRAAETRSPLSVIFLKIDDFASLARAQSAATKTAAGTAVVAAAISVANGEKRSGFAGGRETTPLEQLLACMGEVIKRRIRETDVGAVLTAGEFAVILPGTNLDDGRRVADSLKSLMIGASKNLFPCTISFGVAAYNWASDAPEHTLQQARESLDEALNQLMRSG